MDSAPPHPGRPILYFLNGTKSCRPASPRCPCRQLHHCDWDFASCIIKGPADVTTSEQGTVSSLWLYRDPETECLGNTLLVSHSAPSQEEMHSKRKMLLLISCVLYFLFIKYHFRDEVELRLSDWFNPRKRPDVVTTTDWLAPVIWEGTFNRRVLEEYYRGQDLTIGLAVLATGRIADQYLELFMQSANKHFMTGYRVIFYIMVDAMCQLPNLEPGPLQTFQVFTIREDSREDFHLMHMKNLASHILGHIQDEVDFLFSMTANRVFQNDFGVETLGTSVAQLHAWWYFKDIKDFPYERRFRSAACILLGEGDFYYDGSVVGGTPLEILDFIQEYLEGMIHDKENGLNSTYERYLNKYFFTHKPTKLLSPEYSWDTALQLPAQIWLVKAAQCSHMCLHT